MPAGETREGSGNAGNSKNEGRRGGGSKAGRRVGGPNSIRNTSRRVDDPGQVRFGGLKTGWS